MQTFLDMLVWCVAALMVGGIFSRPKAADARTRAEAALRVEAEKTLADACTFLERTVIDERDGGHKIVLAPHHKEALAAFAKYARVVWQSWPGAGKSTVLLGYTLYCIARNPNIRVYYLGPSIERASRFVDAIRRYIESSPEVQAIAPYLTRGASWTRDGFTIERGPGIRQETLQAGSIDQRKVGVRIDLLLLDDIVDLHSSETLAAREKMERHIRLELLPRLSDGGRVIFVGTPFHPDDALAVRDRDSQWHSVKHPVYLEDGKTPRWNDQQWSVSNLDQLKRSMADVHWDQLYLLRAPEQGAGRFDRRAVMAAVEAGRGLTINPPEWNPVLSCVVGVDPAFSTDAKSDNSAIVAIALTPYQGLLKIDLVTCQQGKWSADELCSRILHIATKTGATVVCESNAAQVLLSDLLYEKARARGIDPPDVVKHFTSAASKADIWTGLEAMTGSFMRREWRIPSRWEDGEMFGESKAFVDALLEYKPSSTGAHLVDAVAAAWFAWRHARTVFDLADPGGEAIFLALEGITRR